MGNQIPDKSWMLYLLELFNRQNIPAELNLICSFNNDGKFDAIFNGVNQYQFKQISPIVGHSYIRQIIMNSQKECISYLLEDRNTKQTERFDLQLNMGEEFSSFTFEAYSLFTGIEWWNKIGNFPYPIRYHVEISQLMYISVITRNTKIILLASSLCFKSLKRCKMLLYKQMAHVKQ